MSCSSFLLSNLVSTCFRCENEIHFWVEKEIQFRSISMEFDFRSRKRNSNFIFGSKKKIEKSMKIDHFRSILPKKKLKFQFWAGKENSFSVQFWSKKPVFEPKRGQNRPKIDVFGPFSANFVAFLRNRPHF